MRLSQIFVLREFSLPVKEGIELSVIQICLFCEFRGYSSCFVLSGHQALAAQTTCAMLQDSGNEGAHLIHENANGS